MPNATIRGTKATKGRNAPGLIYTTATIEVAAAAAANTKYSMFKIPAQARLVPELSKFYHDDLDAAGAPTMDVGLFNVNSNIIDDDNALADGVNVTAAGSTSLVGSIEDHGKEAWEFVNGQTTDPKGELEVAATLKDAAADTGGTITCALAYYID